MNSRLSDSKLTTFRISSFLPSLSFQSQYEQKLYKKVRSDVWLKASLSYLTYLIYLFPQAVKTADLILKKCPDNGGEGCSSPPSPFLSFALKTPLSLPRLLLGC